MSWLTNLAGKAEDFLVNIDEKTASVLQDRNMNRPKETMYVEVPSYPQRQTKRSSRQLLQKKQLQETKSNISPSRKSASPIKNYPVPGDIGGNDIKKDLQISKSVPKKSNRNKQQQRVESSRVNKHNDTTRLEFTDEVLMHDYDPQLQKLLKMAQKNYDHIHDIEEKAEEEAGENKEELKRDIATLNNEVKKLLLKVKKTYEDGQMAESKFLNMEKLYSTMKSDNEELRIEIETLKEQLESQCISNSDISKLSAAYKMLEDDYTKLSKRNKELEEQLREMDLSRQSTTSIQDKLETELRFAHVTIKDLQVELDKSRVECQQTQADWNTYKIRVKSMLMSKDKELQALQLNQGDSKILVPEELNVLRKEKDNLLCEVRKISDELSASSAVAQQLESRSQTADRLVVALREALREERIARNKVENECMILNKELKNLEHETSQQIASLRATILEQETRSQVCHSPSSLTLAPASDGSALNVAERRSRLPDENKMHMLTQSLISKQAKIDLLIADNNALKLQIENMELKYRSGLANLRGDRIVQVNDGDVIIERAKDHLGTPYSDGLQHNEENLNMRDGITPAGRLTCGKRWVCEQCGQGRVHIKSPYQYTKIYGSECHQQHLDTYRCLHEAPSHC